MNLFCKASIWECALDETSKELLENHSVMFAMSNDRFGGKPEFIDTSTHKKEKNCLKSLPYEEFALSLQPN